MRARLADGPETLPTRYFRRRLRSITIAPAKTANAVVAEPASTSGTTDASAALVTPTNRIITFSIYLSYTSGLGIKHF
jgi:hypothetical protein